MDETINGCTIRKGISENKTNSLTSLTPSLFSKKNLLETCVFQQIRLVKNFNEVMLTGKRIKWDGVLGEYSNIIKN